MHAPCGDRGRAGCDPAARRGALPRASARRGLHAASSTSSTCICSRRSVSSPAVFVAKAEQYEELQRALEELRRADEHKDQFVSIASHELRTPIAIVYGIASTMSARGDELAREQLHELRQALLEQSVRLRDLTEQLLDLSRFDAGRIRVRPRPFSPHESVEALLPRIAPDRLGDVQVEIDPAVELVSDPDAFERVVGNLIGNALKYGAPPVVVRGRARDGMFRLAVEDRGTGRAEPVRAAPLRAVHARRRDPAQRRRCRARARDRPRVRRSGRRRARLRAGGAAGRRFVFAVRTRQAARP